MAQKKPVGKQGRRTGAATRGFPIWPVVIGIVVIAAVGTVVALSVHKREAVGCTPAGQHEHASFAVWANGEEYRWLGPDFDYPRAGTLAGHIHQAEPQTVHMESATACITLASFFEIELKSDLSPDALALDSAQHDGKTFRDGEGGKLRYFLGEPPAGWIDNKTRAYMPPSNVTWREVPDLPHHQPRDGEYILVDFGNDDDATIRAHELAIPMQNKSEAAAH
ncbi:MAG TPA: hypothetical protein VM370_09585 [Candidatus Thermoplasmatota archaeon]|nr:hypothetical protein [Candidatus Thermoplasmatota archaeon]